MSYNSPGMIVGREWIVDASGCDPASLRDLPTLDRLARRLVVELDLKPVGQPQYHVFPGEAGVTGLILLSESHIAFHTYPELGVATFNLYCCRERPEWPWDTRLREALSASDVAVRCFDRTAHVHDSVVAGIRE